MSEDLPDEIRDLLQEWIRARRSLDEALGPFSVEGRSAPSGPVVLSQDRIAYLAAARDVEQRSEAQFWAACERHGIT